eukprot:883107-Amphidinium_carterae.1
MTTLSACQVAARHVFTQHTYSHCNRDQTRKDYRYKRWYSTPLEQKKHAPYPKGHHNTTKNIIFETTANVTLFIGRTKKAREQPWRQDHKNETS